jgi:biopolymer transport protein ExbD
VRLKLRLNHLVYARHVKDILTRTAETLAIMALILYCAACGANHEAKGFLIDLPNTTGPCGDGPRRIVAVALGGHKARLNKEPNADIPAVVQQLREVMKYRAEKVVYVTAEQDASWGDFLEVVEGIWPEADVVSIFTPQVAALSRRTLCLYPSCRDCRNLGGYGTRKR